MQHHVAVHLVMLRREGMPPIPHKQTLLRFLGLLLGALHQWHNVPRVVRISLADHIFHPVGPGSQFGLPLISGVGPKENRAALERYSDFLCAARVSGPTEKFGP